MANRRSINHANGQLQVRQSGDFLEPNPGTQTFTYTSGKLTSIAGPTGTKTFTYSSGKLETITDTGSNTLSTFNYTGSTLDDITVTSL